MKINDKILIKNIYYMLSYAFDVLNQSNYQDVDSEEFDNIEDLFAAILSKGISQQLKQGLYKEYIDKNENLSLLKGRINLNETIKNKFSKNVKLYCDFDEYSVNNELNKILKTTMVILIKSKNVKKEYKNSLKKRLMYFSDVETLNPRNIEWARLEFHRHNKTYEMLINICYFVIDSLILTTEAGGYKMKSFLDTRLSYLFEKFVLKYYKKHFNKLKVNAKRIEWKLNEAENDVGIQFLPKMETDIIISDKVNTLIIDTKYYSKSMQYNFDFPKLVSANLYQIYTYVKNYDNKTLGEVSGLLLYAKTIEDITPNFKANMDGNTIGASTIDLNREFKEIRLQLDNIIYEYFNRSEYSSVK